MKKFQFSSFLIFLIFNIPNVQCFKIDRAIVSSDNNPMYLDFWPIVARAWKEIIGIKPTLALIADKSVIVDESLGDVIRFEPIPTISTALYSQVIRLLIPAYFPDDVSITSDIDMIPINREYFINSVKDIPEDHFVVYRDAAYNSSLNQFPICYNAAKGIIFKEIFQIKQLSDIPKIVMNWAQTEFGWFTDEKMLYKCLTNWNKYHTQCTK